MATAQPSKLVVKKAPAAAAKPAAKPAAAPAKPAATTTKATLKKAAPAPAATEAVDTSTAAVIDSGDLIVATVTELSALKEGKAFELVPKLLNNIDHDYFKLGGVLRHIQLEGWHMNKGYDSFKSYVEAETGMAYRKAMYLISIYDSLVEAGIPWATVGHLGWTKLKDLAPVLDKDNVAEWVTYAENCTAMQLAEAIKESLKGTAAGSNTGADNNPAASSGDVTSFSVKVHPDQKETINAAIDKAKTETGSTVPAVALEHIALDFLSGTKKGASLQSLMKAKTAEEVLNIFTTVFPEVKLSVELPEEAAAG